MKKISLLLAGGLLAANLALPVWAEHEQYGEPAMGTGKTEKMGMGKMKHKMMGWHKMSGTVKDIDQAKGMLTLFNNEAEMMLHFPPASIKDLKNGDTITVELGFSVGANE